MPASRKKLARWAALLLVAVALVGAGSWWWQRSHGSTRTDDAYVGANTVQVAAEVPGVVAALHIENNQHVKAGQVLFELDRRPYVLALEKARAQLAQRRAEAENAGRNNSRNQQLVKRGFLSKQGAEAAQTQVATSQAAVQDAEATVAQAELDLERTRVAAAADGVVANLSLRPGSPVQARSPLFALIADEHFWVDANFKETQLHAIRPGQSARVKVDMYPGRVFHGVVESVSGGAGTAFSLLPPQNATGNWVKVTQRVPVRVRITDPDPQRPLRIGTTATVEVESG
jgi:membrane fusion protein (multidrug efflux system)